MNDQELTKKLDKIITMLDNQSQAIGVIVKELRALTKIVEKRGAPGTRRNED